MALEEPATDVADDETSLDDDVPVMLLPPCALEEDVTEVEEDPG